MSAVGRRECDMVGESVEALLMTTTRKHDDDDDDDGTPAGSAAAEEEDSAAAAAASPSSRRAHGPPPHDNDVVCGRGKPAEDHAGNKWYLDRVKERRTAYQKEKKAQRRLVAEEVVDLVQARNPPGRFLKRDPATTLWNDVGNAKAVAKAAQDLRRPIDKERRPHHRHHHGGDEEEEEEEEKQRMVGPLRENDFVLGRGGGGGKGGGGESNLSDGRRRRHIRSGTASFSRNVGCFICFDLFPRAHPQLVQPTRRSGT
jgi:hypothetical protein